jgi:7,8-dihydropterin-6-yl-methyl-4-(beta-D-ribofuranosyl)aminobenzene 5'-phosphate synthase
LCNDRASAHDIGRATPRLATGPAVDPIALAPVDEVVLTTLVDNLYDALLVGDDRITRAPSLPEPPKLRSSNPAPRTSA